MTDRITLTLDAGVADVRLNRPDKLNALDPALIEGIAATIDTLTTLPGLRAVVLSGEGRGFCAGLDMETMATIGDQNFDIMARTHGLANLFQQVAWGWRTLPVPVIAAIHGVAFGGGFQILSGADIRIAAPDARLSIMEMKWGLVPDMAGMVLWRGTIRDDVLRELIYTNREVSGAEAVPLGLVTRTADDPHAEAMILAHQIARRNPEAVRGAKRLANAAFDTDAAGMLFAESHEQGLLIRTANQIEAVMANLQNRPPQFTD